MREEKDFTEITNEKTTKKAKGKRTYVAHFNTYNPEHLTYRYRELSFDILGGINTESYMMLRTMLVIRGNQAVEREHLDLYNHFELNRFQKRLAEKTGFSLSYIEEAFGELINDLEIYKHEQIEKRSQKARVPLSSVAEKQALSLLKSPTILHDIQNLIQQIGLVGNEKNSLVLFLIYLSRFDEYPLHAVIRSKYHYLQNKIGDCIPDEHKIHISYLSENALYYFEENELAHKILLIEDTGTNKTQLAPLHALQSHGVLRKTVTQKDAHGDLRTIQKHVNGPVCASISTKQDERFKHHVILSFVLEDDDGEKQEQRLIDYQRRRSAGKINPYQELQAQELLQNIQRLLKPIRVINPYAEQLILPKELQNQSITNTHYLRFIETITFLKQYQSVPESKVDSLLGEVCIETSIEDIEEANELLAHLLINKCDPLNRPTRTYFERLKAYLDSKKNNSQSDSDSCPSGTDFTNGEMHRVTHIPISTIKRYHEALLKTGYIMATGEGNRASGFQYTLTGQDEHEHIETKIKYTLNTSLSTIRNGKGSPKPRVAQNENGLPKPSNHKGLRQVAQNEQWYREES